MNARRLFSSLRLTALVGLVTVLCCQTAHADEAYSIYEGVSSYANPARERSVEAPKDAVGVAMFTTVFETESAFSNITRQMRPEVDSIVASFPQLSDTVFGVFVGLAYEVESMIVVRLDLIKRIAPQHGAEQSVWPTRASDTAVWSTFGKALRAERHKREAAGRLISWPRKETWTNEFRRHTTKAFIYSTAPKFDDFIEPVESKRCRSTFSAISRSDSLYAVLNSVIIPQPATTLDIASGSGSAQLGTPHGTVEVAYESALHRADVATRTQLEHGIAISNFEKRLHKYTSSLSSKPSLYNSGASLTKAKLALVSFLNDMQEIRSYAIENGVLTQYQALLSPSLENLLFNHHRSLEAATNVLGEEDLAIRAAMHSFMNDPLLRQVKEAERQRETAQAASREQEQERRRGQAESHNAALRQKMVNVYNAQVQDAPTQQSINNTALTSRMSASEASSNTLAAAEHLKAGRINDAIVILEAVTRANAGHQAAHRLLQKAYAERDER